MAVMEIADPGVLITFTGLDGPWPKTQSQIARARRKLRELGYRFSWVYVVEPAETGDRPHFHALARVDGGIILLEDLKRVSSTQGFHDVQIKLARPDHIPYILKEIPPDPRGSHPNDPERRLKEHLARNGGRPMHANPGFWRTSDGRPSTLRSVERSMPLRTH